MAGQWNDWLGTLRAAGKGGQRLPQLTIDRGLDYSKVLAFGADLSADTITATMRASPDAGGAALAEFTVAVGSYSGGVTEVTISLTDTQTAALPADSDADGVEEFVFDLLRNGQRLLAGTIPIAGKVTNGS